VRSAPSGGSAWERLKHSADLACQRGGAYLSGQYTFAFSNESAWTVKLHLVEDVEGTGTRHGTGQARHGYFLTLPAQTRGIEIPMMAPLVLVTAGFFRPERGAFEVFWERRRFSWEPGLRLTVRSRHSIDANRFHVDVYAGAPEADSWVPNAAYARREPARSMMLLPQVPGRTLEGYPAVAYTQVGNQWSAADVTHVLPDGSFFLEDGSFSWLVNPQEQATLMPLDWSIFDFKRPRSPPRADGGTVPLEPPATVEAQEGLRPPLLLGAAGAILAPSIFGKCGGRCGPSIESTADTGTAPTVFSSGQHVQVYCQSKGAWLCAQVAETLPDGSVTVQCGASKSRRTLQRGELARMLKTV